MNKIIILYSTDCPKCKILETKLNQKNIKYETIKDVNEMQDMGIVAVPMLRVDGQLMNFVEANKWVNSENVWEK